MSSHELSTQDAWDNRNVYLPLPEEVDNEWCFLFNRVYGRKGKRTVVNAYTFMRESAPLHNCAPPVRQRRMYQEDLKDVPDNGFMIDGEVVGARLVPILDRFTEEFDYVPHLVMRDISDVEGNHGLAFPEEEVWVPLTENDEEIILY